MGVVLKLQAWQDPGEWMLASLNHLSYLLALFSGRVLGMLSVSSIGRKQVRLNFLLFKRSSKLEHISLSEVLL